MTNLASLTDSLCSLVDLTEVHFVISVKSNSIPYNLCSLKLVWECLGETTSFRTMPDMVIVYLLESIGRQSSGCVHTLQWPIAYLSIDQLKLLASRHTRLIDTGPMAARSRSPVRDLLIPPSDWDRFLLYEDIVRCLQMFRQMVVVERDRW